MAHIFKNHMLPAASRKSFFTTTSWAEVRNLVLSTVADVVEILGQHGTTGLPTKPNLCGGAQIK